MQAFDWASSGNSYPEDGPIWALMKPDMDRWVAAIKIGDAEGAHAVIKYDVAPRLVTLEWYKNFRGKVSGALQAECQNHPLPALSVEGGAELHEQVDDAMDARLRELEVEAEATRSRTQLIDSLDEDAAVQQLLAPAQAEALGDRRAFELALRQALDIIVVKHLARQSSPNVAVAVDHKTFAGFSRLLGVCVASQLGNKAVDQGEGHRSINCCAVCVEGGPVTRVENLMMHELVSNVRVKGMANLRVVVKTLTYEALKEDMAAQRQ